MNTTADSKRPRRSTGTVLIEFLGSMNLAITLLVVIAIAAVIGTVLQQNQPYNNYVFKFGPFWFEVFKTLGLFDIYGSPWFLTLLGFLLVSTSVCVYRNLPAMLRDMSHFRLEVQEKSLRAFHLKQLWQVHGKAGELAEAYGRLLGRRGYKVRQKTRADGLVVAAMKGGASRLGYLLSHIGIVVICLGALLDGNLPLKLAELAGNIKVETRDLPVEQIPAESILPVDNMSFRGSVNIPEGGRSAAIFLPVRNGYLMQRLPFAVELEAFRVEYYKSGQPKSFESDVVIHDPELAEPLRRTIAVNHPLIYKGHAIYQASFGDGGTGLEMRAWSLDTPEMAPLQLNSAINRKLQLATPRGERTLEFNDFKLHNVFPAEEGSGKKFQNYGPSLIFKLRKPNGEALEYVNYLAPVSFNGRLYRMSGMRATPSEPYRYLQIPLDDEVSIERFLKLRAMAMDEQRMRRLAEEQATGLEMSDAQREEIIASVQALLAVFIDEGIDAVVERVERNAPAEERDAVLQSYIQLIQSMVASVYLELLADEGVDVSQGINDEQSAFFDDALQALSLVGAYGSPIFLEVSNFNHIESSGLQITKAPGQGVVYFGCVMLMAGVFFMFYLHHRRLWLLIREEGEHAEILFAGSGHRDRADFSKEFTALHEALEIIGRGQGNS